MDSTLVKRLADHIDIESFRNYIHKKGISLMSQCTEVKTTHASINTFEQLEALMTSLGKWKSLSLLCAYSAEYKKLQFDLDSETEIKTRFARVAEEIPIHKFHNIQITEVLVSDIYELSCLCFSLSENGMEDLFRKVIKSVERKWIEIEKNNDEVDLTEKERCADLCLVALCRVSQTLKDNDELKLSLKRTADRAKHFTTDPDEALALIETSEIHRVAYGDITAKDTKQKTFSERLKLYTGEKYKLTTRGFILATEIMFLFSELSRKFSNSLHQTVIKKLKEVGTVFEVEQEDSNIENYRKQFLKKTYCVEALCLLGISFTLKHVPDVKITRDEMRTVRQCLNYLVTPKVWISLSLRWKAMTYAALTKWFHLNSSSENAEICAERLNGLLSNFLIHQKDALKANASILLQSITRESKMQPWNLEPIDFETEMPEHPIKVFRIPDNIVVIQTIPSNNIDRSYQTLFQHILFVTEEEGNQNKAVAIASQEEHFKTAIRTENLEQVKRCLYGLDPLLEVSDGISALHLSLQIQNPNIMKQFAKRICTLFGKYIQKDHKGLLHRVWLGYKANNEQKMNISDLRIVAVCKKTLCKSLPTEFRNLKIYWRQKDQVSNEAKLTLHNEDIVFANKHKISGSDAKQLFDAHLHLSMIHISSFKSTKFQTVDEAIIAEPCVALYCQVKGIIPIGEKPFPKVIGDLKTDVREGHLVFGAGQSLKPGEGICCISTRKSGTVGGCLKLSDNKVALVTASHIFAKIQDLEKNEEYQKSFFEGGGILVHRKDSYEEIGKVIKGGLWNLSEKETSVDAVLVEIKKEFVPTDYTFPSTDESILRSKGFTRMTMPRYFENRILTLDEIKENHEADILKYGGVTQLTKGRIVIDGAHVRVESGTLAAVDYDDNGNKIHPKEFRLYHQIGIQNIGPGNFFEPGDSGSFCYVLDKDRKNKMRPFAMAIGIDSGFCIATPLEAVFRKLDLDFSKGDQLYPLFQDDVIETASQTESDETTGNESVPNDIKTMFTSIMTKVDRIMKDVSNLTESQNKIEEDVADLKEAVYQKT